MKEDVTFKYWLIVANAAKWKMDDGYTRPNKVSYSIVPNDLSGLTMGELIELGSIAEDQNAVTKMCKVVLNLDEQDVMNARAVDVVRFVGWCCKEVKHINKLFEGTSNKHSAQEIQAGVENLKFGLFGLLDWYAKRMGITNHDDVLKVPWMRVYKCLDMDNKTNNFNRKLQEVYANENKRKGKTNLH